MSDDSNDPRWPKLLSLAVHEFRTPITVVAGYLRMVLKERAGTINEQQRKLLEEAEKSCGRLSGLVTEMSDLGRLESNAASLNRAQFDLVGTLEEIVAQMPELPDRTVGLILEGPKDSIVIDGDVTRLRSALTSILTALRRELVTSDRLVIRHFLAGTKVVLAIGDPGQIDTIAAAEPVTLARFDEWRGGSGLSLAIARRVIDQHGGALFSPPGDGKSGALIMLPRA